MVAIQSAAVGLGFAMLIYMLINYDSQEGGSGQSEEKELDYRHYTVDKLRSLLDEIEYEQGLIYSQNYMIMQNAKESGTWKPSMLKSLEKRVERAIDKKTLKLAEEFCLDCHPKYCSYERCFTKGRKSISISQFTKWLVHFEQKSADIKKYQERQLQLETDFFDNAKITQLPFEDKIPAEMTTKLYKKIIKLTFARMRKEIWAAMQEKKKANGGKDVGKNEILRIYQSITKKQAAFSAEIYTEEMNDPKIPPLQASRVIKMFQAVQQVSGANGAMYTEEITEIAKEHDRLVKEIIEGKSY